MYSLLLGAEAIPGQAEAISPKEFLPK